MYRPLLTLLAALAATSAFALTTPSGLVFGGGYISPTAMSSTTPSPITSSVARAASIASSLEACSTTIKMRGSWGTARSVRYVPSDANRGDFRHAGV